MGAPARIYADPARERIVTSATVITGIRTVIAVALAVWAAYDESLTLLVASLVVYWVGDSLDGIVARIRDCETRTGAALDILSDRFCAAAFYVGLAWTLPHLGPAIFVYLAEFMVIDCFLSLSFLAWPITSPNYFYVVDRRIWLFNWSRAGKTVNSGLFAVMLLVTRDYAWGMWLGLAIALGLFAMKSVSLVWMMRLGIPVPSAALASDAEAPLPTGRP
jgi:CDP-diacylglycerol--glycerol-3-phosphate 3-phosphatidyltransferase